MRDDNAQSDNTQPDFGIIVQLNNSRPDIAQPDNSKPMACNYQCVHYQHVLITHGLIIGSHQTMPWFHVRVLC